MPLREDADRIVRASIRAVQPEAAVQRALEGFSCAGRIVLAAIGKAAWPMADAAWRAMASSSQNITTAGAPSVRCGFLKPGTRSRMKTACVPRARFSG